MNIFANLRAINANLLTHFLLGFVICVSTCYSGELRTWTSADGSFKTDAELVSQTESEVTLKISGGREVRVPKAKLSAADLTFLAQQATPLSTAAPSVAAPSSSTADDPILIPSELVAKYPLPQPSALLKKVSPRDLSPVPEVGQPDYAAELKDWLSVPPAPQFRELRSFELELISPREAILSADGRFLVDHDAAGGKLKLWNINKGEIECVWECGPLANARCFAVSPQGTFMAAGFADQRVAVYDVTKQQEVTQINVLKEKQVSVLAVAIGWKADKVHFCSSEAALYHYDFAGQGTQGIKIEGNAARLLIPSDAELSVSEDDNTVCFRINRQMILVSHRIPLSDEEAIDLKIPEKLFILGSIIPLQRGAAVHQALNQGAIYFDGITKGALYRLFKPIGQSWRESERIEHSGFSRVEAQKISVNRRGDRIWLASNVNPPIIDVFDTKLFSHPVTIAPPKVKAHPNETSWISAEANRLIYCSNKTLTVYGLAVPNPPSLCRCYDELARALLARRYDRMDGIFRELNSSRIAFPDGQRLSMATELVSLMARNSHVSKSDWLQHIDAYMRHKPNSVFARLIMAQIYHARASAVRGGAPAAQVPPANMQAYRQFGEEMQKLLDPIMQMPVPPAVAYFVQLNAARIQGWDFKKQVQISDLVRKQHPDSVDFHTQMLIELQPRWFGKPGDCESYAAVAADKVGGKEGNILYARMVMEFYRVRYSREFLQEFNFDAPRVAEGLLAWSETDPSAPFLYAYWVEFTDWPDEKSALRFKDERLVAAKKKVAQAYQNQSWNPQLVNDYPQMKSMLEGSEPVTRLKEVQMETLPNQSPAKPRPLKPGSLK